MAYGGVLGVEAKNDENHFQDEWVISGRELEREGEREEVKQKRGDEGDGKREGCYMISN